MLNKKEQQHKKDYRLERTQFKPIVQVRFAVLLTELNQKSLTNVFTGVSMSGISVISVFHSEPGLQVLKEN